MCPDVKGLILIESDPCGEPLSSLKSVTSLLQNCFSGCCVAWLICVPVCFSGCRVLRSNRQTRELAAARQMSLRGAEALQQKKFSDAESLFGEAIRHSPADERAQWGYAEVLWQRGQSEQATEHMLKATETSGGNPELVVRLGQMYLEQEDSSQAIVQADIALRNQRTHAGAWALKGDALRKQNKPQAALDCYHRSLIYRSDAPAVQVAVAEIYRQLGRPQRALATLDHLADHHTPEKIPPRAWMLKGLALADLGEEVEAKHCWRLAAQYASESQSELLLELASVQYTSGDLAEARLCLGRVLKQDSTNIRALDLQLQLDQSFADLSSGRNGASALPVGFQHNSQQILQRN